MKGITPALKAPSLSKKARFNEQNDTKIKSLALIGAEIESPEFYRKTGKFPGKISGIRYQYWYFMIHKIVIYKLTPKLDLYLNYESSSDQNKNNGFYDSFYESTFVFIQVLKFLYK